MVYFGPFDVNLDSANTYIFFYSISFDQWLERLGEPLLDGVNISIRYILWTSLSIGDVNLWGKAKDLSEGIEWPRTGDVGGATPQWTQIADFWK